MANSTVEQDFKDKPVPRNNAEAFKMCRDYQQQKGYMGLTQHEVSYIIGNKPVQGFIGACGPNVSSVRSGGEMVYSFRYKH